MTILEGELGTVPRAHHRAVFQRALGQRSAEVRTRVNEAADSPMLASQQNVRVADSCANHGVLRQRSAVHDRCGLLRKFRVGVRDADAASIHQIATEIRRGHRDRIAHPGTRSPAIVRVLPP